MTQNIFTQDEAIQNLAGELGIADLPQEVRDELIAKFGENLMLRLTTEILKILPEAKHEEFSSLIGGGDMQTIHDLVNPFIPNFDIFVQQETRKEIEAVKVEMGK